MNENPYLETVRPAIPRLLSLLNRNNLSPTFGSFDRNYWHYRTVTDFTSPIFQQGVLSLALLHENEIFGRDTYKNPALYEFLLAGIERWTELQHANGSFDEWFPNEFSHVATAFTAYAISETYRVMNLDIPECYRSLHKAGLWLGNNLDRKVLNHTAGAIAALSNIAVITEDERIQHALDKNIEVMASYQSPEGWFHENGGFDTAYQSVSIDYLVKANEISPDKRLSSMIEKAVSFLSYFVYPDSTIGCGIGSRNTQYLFPYGLLRNSRDSPLAGKISRRYLASLVRGQAVTPAGTDDRYFLFFFLPNFLQSAVECAHRTDLEPDFGTDSLFDSDSVHLRDAGVLIRRRKNSVFYLNYRKGGVYRYYRNGKLEGADSGYFARDKNGVIATNALANNAEDAMLGDQSVLIETSMKEVNYSLPFKTMFIPFRIVNFTLGFFPAFSNQMTEWIKHIFIRRRKDTGWRFRRLIEFLEDGKIRIQDNFPGIEDTGIEIYRNTASTAAHVPTSRYFLPSDIAEPAMVFHGKIATELEP